jgi:dipeptide transport system substrate-binding protein
MVNRIFRFCLLGLTLMAASASAKSLVFCAEGNEEYFSPSINATGFEVTDQMFDRLVAFKPGTSDIVPALASHWTVSDDGLAYTFYLRRQVAWQGNAHFKPQRFLNADDVVFTFERQWKTDHPYHGVVSKDYPYFQDTGMSSTLSAVRKVDEHTVRFELQHPVAPFLANLAMSWAGIESAEYAQAMAAAGTPERMVREPLGTGPFQLVSYQPKTQLVFAPFAQHWAGAPRVSGLVFDIEPSADVRWSKLRRGECHIMASPQPSDLPTMRRTPGVKVHSVTGLNVAYLAYNTAKPPFNDPRVRRALNLAIDKRRILRELYQHTAVPAINPIPPTMLGYNRDLNDISHNPEQARKLLIEADYPFGYEAQLWAMGIQRSYMSNAMGVARIIQDNLKAVGVNAVIKTQDWTTYLRSLSAGEHDMGLLGWTGDNGDTDNFLNTLLGCRSVGGYNVAQFCHPEYDDLVFKAKISKDREERKRLYERAQVVLQEQAPWLTLAHTVLFNTVREEVVGFSINPLGLYDFKDVQLLDRP